MPSTGSALALHPAAWAEFGHHGLLAGQLLCCLMWGCPEGLLWPAWQVAAAAGSDPGPQTPARPAHHRWATTLHHTVLC